MRKILILLSIPIIALISCGKEYLNVPAVGQLTTSEVSSTDPDGLCIAAYASLGNDHYDRPFSLWPYGNVRAGDAYKGGRDNNDIGDFFSLETFVSNRIDFGEYDGLWYLYFIAIQRANAALAVLDNVSTTTFPLKVERQAEMRFLRAHNYFQLKVLWKFVPYLDETVSSNNIGKVSNVALPNDTLWARISADFQFAVNNLPATQTDLGRPTKWAAMAYLAKTNLYRAYHQDNAYNSSNAHTITSVNQSELNNVISLTNQIIASGQYSLQPDFGYNFMEGPYENGVESLYSIQYSTADGIQFGRLNFGDLLSAPMEVGCCDFQKPSWDLANAYKTDVNGLPEFTTYNIAPLSQSDAVDPRLDHTIAIPGHMWKYEQSTIFGQSWARTPALYGYFNSLKENVQWFSPTNSQYVNMNPFYPNAKDRIVIRYADVLLWKAEALIQTNQLEAALPIINQLRSRAAASTSMLKLADSTYESNYNVGNYVDGVNCNWNSTITTPYGVTETFAMQALQWERRLEFAEEGCRFFDLVRWGIASQYLNAFFASEQKVFSWLSVGVFTPNRDEYLPIPYNQINFSHGVYKQNVGYTE